jgi:hypothetical protein
MSAGHAIDAGRRVENPGSHRGHGRGAEALGRGFFFLHGAGQSDQVAEHDRHLAESDRDHGQPSMQRVLGIRRHAVDYVLETSHDKRDLVIASRSASAALTTVANLLPSEFASRRWSQRSYWSEWLLRRITYRVSIFSLACPPNKVTGATRSLTQVAPANLTDTNRADRRQANGRLVASIYLARRTESLDPRRWYRERPNAGDYFRRKCWKGRTLAEIRNIRTEWGVLSRSVDCRERHPGGHLTHEAAQANASMHRIRLVRITGKNSARRLGRRPARAGAPRSLA